MLAYNTSEYNITKRTPFFINKGFKADVSLKIRKCEELIPHIITKIKEIYKLQNKLRQNLVFFNKIIKKFTNYKKVKELTLKKRDKVYLLQRTPNTKITSIQTIRLSNKVDFAKLEPFKILKILEPVMYKLNLPNSIRIMRIRYILVLKPADSEIPLIKDIPNIDSKSQKKI